MSWIQYSPDCEFPLQNLPYGVFYVPSRGETPQVARPGVALGDQVIDLRVLHSDGLFDDVPSFAQHPDVFAKLNEFMSLGRPTWVRVRTILTELFSADNGTIRDNAELRIRAKALVPLADVANLVPARIGDYTDFYASKEHATNLGKMFRPNDAPLLPNWVWIPIGYHGRASSVVVSGTPVRRPNGQTKPPTDTAPAFRTCAKLDYELEMAFFVGPSNELGEPISVDFAEDHIFGVVLMNDWSARDIQAWEYVPLGPFTGKNFATTISPWIVTLEALDPFRATPPTKDPAPLTYLKDDSDSNYDINLEVYLRPEGASESYKIGHSNFKYMYWSMKQQLIQHTVTGCNMNSGDLLGSGTISGPEGQLGSLIESTWNGKNPITLPDGQTRTFIQDGDTITFRGFCQGEGFRIGFGECSGTVVPAHDVDK